MYKPVIKQRTKFINIKYFELVSIKISIIQKSKNISKPYKKQTIRR